MGWNIVIISIIMIFIQFICFFWMMQEFLVVGDDVVYGEEVYVLWGDGEKYDINKYGILDVYYDISIFYGLDVGICGFIVSF